MLPKKNEKATNVAENKNEKATNSAKKNEKACFGRLLKKIKKQYFRVSFLI